MSMWFFLLGVPFLALGVAAIVANGWMLRQLTAFPRNRVAGCVLCAIGWFWTAYECHTIGIEVFDKFLKAFPGELWILATVLTFLMCKWMDNLLSVRGVCAIFMLFPASLFQAVRLCDSQMRLLLVVCAYVCAIIGMFGMFYPWRIRQALAWASCRPALVRTFGGGLAVVGSLFVVLGIVL